MKTYREIPVSERLSEFEGTHTVVDADLNMFQVTYDKEFGFHEEFTDCSGITHWLELVVEDRNNDIYKGAIERWGERSQMEMAQEEATELALAIRKYIRTPSYQRKHDLAGEIADVEIMIEQIKFMIPEIIDTIENIKFSKIVRLDFRVKQNRFE